jgi:hypothetical protein
VENNGSGTITTAYDFYAASPTNTGTMGTFYGLYIESPTAATTNYAIYSAGGTNYFAGNVGIGITSPSDNLDVKGEIAATLGTAPGQFRMVAGNYGAFWRNDGANTYLLLTNSGSPYGSWNSLRPFYVNDSTGSVTINNAASIQFSDASTQTTAWTGVLCGGDYAESVDVSGERTLYEPGDVLVIDKASGGSFAKSSTPYSKMVAGIYSTKPGAVGRRQTDPSKAKAEVPMAMVGIVPTKASAENGPIEPGDLLVTSSTLGLAMKGTDDRRMLGAVIGKALNPLDSGTGVIEVLVSLQ